MLRTTRLLLVGTLSLAACGPNYTFMPATQATAQIAGRSAAAYQIPPELPEGEVRIATFGIVGLKPRNQSDDTELRALHIRMAISNNSDQNWVVDTRHVLADLPGQARSRAVYASAVGATPPIVTIAPHDARTIDLFFPLPRSMQKASRIPQFDVLWQVQTQARLVSERTPFERMEIVTYPDYPDSYFGYPGYYDPYYSGFGFYGTGFFPPPYVGRSVVVPPRGYPAQRIR